MFRKNTRSHPFEADGDCPAYRGAVPSTEGKMKAPSAENEEMYGVPLEETLDGKINEFEYSGIVEIESGAAIDAMIDTIMDASGRLIAAADISVSASILFIVGKPLKAASASGEILPVQIQKKEKYVPGL